MKKMKELATRIGFLALWLCSLSFSTYAIGPEISGKDPGENRSVPVVPATGSEGVNSALPEQKTTTSNDFLHGGSPLSDPDDKSPQNKVDLTSAKPPSEQEISVLVDQVLFRMANMGLGENLSKTLNYISHGDYAGLTAFQKENPGVMNAFANALQDVSAPHVGTIPGIVLPSEPPAFDSKGFMGSDVGSKSGNDYINRWLAEFRKVQTRLSGPGMEADRPELLVSEVTKLYQPIATRISEVSKDVQEARHSLKGPNGRKTSSDDLLKDFSEKARKAIVDSLSQAQANLADGLLSNPIEATAFASETVPASGAAGGARPMLSPMLNGKHRQYRVIDSVFIGKEFAYAQKMLHPPANLHPYLKWLLYTRNLTPRMMENYLKTREAAMTLYMRAKEGQGNIRYKGQVYGAFLPFAETAAGNFELVEPVSGK